MDECPSPLGILDTLPTCVGIVVHFAGSVLSYGQLEAIVQEALAAYKCNVLRSRLPPETAHVDDEGAAGDKPEAAADNKLKVGGPAVDGDVSEWAALISSNFEGRVRRHVTDEN